MHSFPEPLDLSRVRVYSLQERQSLSRLEDMLVDPSQTPAPLDTRLHPVLDTCAAHIRRARARGASVMLIYGAHLIKNGAMAIVNQLISQGWVTHLATNGAGTIHDWELAFLGRTEESVRKNVAQGCFGTWQETGRNILLAIMAGSLRGEGYGRALGRFIQEDGTLLPTAEELEQSICQDPGNSRSAARADLLNAIRTHQLQPKQAAHHPFKTSSILAQAFLHNIPLTVHPGIGYDIFTTHPMYNGAVIGRGAGVDFALFSRAVENLDDGVVLSIGSAIMGPQVFEKSLSCVNNLRLQDNRKVVQGHQIYVVDVQDGGGWDWKAGEPPKSNPAYYLRFCKSYSRMGGEMTYVQADNLTFLHNLLFSLKS